MTREKAKATVEAELRSRNLTKPLDAGEMAVFCATLEHNLDFPTKHFRVNDIRAWAENWQAKHHKRSEAFAVAREARQVPHGQPNPHESTTRRMPNARVEPRP